MQNVDNLKNFILPLVKTACSILIVHRKYSKLEIKKITFKGNNFKFCLKMENFQAKGLISPLRFKGLNNYPSLVLM